MIKNVFFKITAVSSRVQLIEGSVIFGITINVYCLRAANFESKLTLNSDESFQQFRERRRIHSFLCKNDVRLSGMRSSVQRIHSLENVKERDLILMESFFDRSKKNGQRPIVFVYGMVQNAFYLDEERFLNREGSIP